MWFEGVESDEGVGAGSSSTPPGDGERDGVPAAVRAMVIGRLPVGHETIRRLGQRLAVNIHELAMNMNELHAACRQDAFSRVQLDAFCCC